MRLQRRMKSHPYEDVSRWMEFHELAREASTLLSALDVEPWSPALPPSTKDFGSHFAEIHQIYSDSFDECTNEVYPALGKFFQEGQFLSMRPQSAFWLKAMWACISRFVASALSERDGEVRTILPFPKAKVKEVAYWYCSEWWMSRGLEIAAYQAATYPDDPAAVQPLIGNN
jgi:hypothetical protein